MAREETAAVVGRSSADARSFARSVNRCNSFRVNEIMRAVTQHSSADGTTLGWRIAILSGCLDESGKSEGRNQTLIPQRVSNPAEHALEIFFDARGEQCHFFAQKFREAGINRGEIGRMVQGPALAVSERKQDSLPVNGLVLDNDMSNLENVFISRTDPLSAGGERLQKGREPAIRNKYECAPF